MLNSSVDGIEACLASLWTDISRAQLLVPALMEGLGTLSAPELVIDDKTERGFVNWFRTLQQVSFHPCLCVKRMVEEPNTA